MAVKRKWTLGLGFSDEVEKINRRHGFFKKKSSDEWKDFLLPHFDRSAQTLNSSVNRSFWRGTVFLAGASLLFFILILRLFHLQVVHGHQNRELADSNRIKIQIIHAPRGVIYDRNGKVLAENAPGFRLKSNLKNKYRIISREEALALEARSDPRAAALEVDSIRLYPLGEKTAHVLGYVGQINEEQLKNPRFADYKSGDRIGENGIEAQYESLLKGVDGGEIIEVDSQGRNLRVLREEPAIPGRNIYLTIDSDLQSKVFQELKNGVLKVNSCCGAAVVEDPQTGQILALASFPSFDPNVFSSASDEEAVARILSNPDSPILNRVIGGTYPPGSTFKIISAVAALGSGKITPDTMITDNGVTTLGPYRFTNWYFTQYGKTEGPVNLVKALKRSNDSYFYKVGQTIGEQALANWARKLNLGKPLGIDLPDEASGLIADDKWKQANQGQPWYPGDTLHMAIGQGFLLTTPLQVLGFTSLVANNGDLLKPQLLYEVTADDGKGLSKFQPVTLLSHPVPEDDLKVVQTGLGEVVQNGGTAWPFFTFPISTAGKTGTAEFGDPKDRTHAWYTSYAPLDNPKIAMTVLVEGGGEGSNVAAPITKEVYRWFFSPDKDNLLKDIYQVSTSSAKALGE